MKDRYEFITKEFEDGSGSWADIWDNHKKTFLSAIGEVDRIVRLKDQPADIFDCSHLVMWRQVILMNEEIKYYHKELTKFLKQ